MGTSKSLPTPSGGPWTPLKNDITDMLGGGNAQPDHIIGGAIRAAGIAALPPGSRGGSSRSTAAAGAGKTATGGGRSGGRSGRASVGRAAAGLAGFGAAISEGGLDAGLHALGLDELRGKPAVEIVASISDHLAEGVEGLQGELLRNALRDALYEAAALGGDPDLRDMGSSLQSFLEQTGPEGLAELFLSHLVFERIWSLIENHVDARSDGNAASSAMAEAVQNACRAHVRAHMDEAQQNGFFDRIDWFGRGGVRVGQQIAAELEARLAAL